MKLSLVLPCFNEAENLPSVLGEIDRWREKDKIDLEVVAVNDGSKDDTGAVLMKLQQTYPWISIVEHEKNKGYGLAVRAGLDAGSGDTLGFMDSDGQFRPDDLMMLLPLLSDYDFVTGRRAHRADPFVRNMFGKILGGLNVLVFGLWVRDVNCGLKVMKKSIWPAIRPQYGVEKLFNTEMFLRLKRNRIRWTQVNVPHYPRRAGTPTGGSLRVIIRMFKEFADLRAAMSREKKPS